MTSFVLSKVSKNVRSDDIKKKNGKKPKPTIYWVTSHHVGTHGQAPPSRQSLHLETGYLLLNESDLMSTLAAGCLFFFVGRNQENSIKMDVFLPSQGPEVIFSAGDWDLFLSLGTSPHPRQVHISNDC